MNLQCNTSEHLNQPVLIIIRGEIDMLCNSKLYSNAINRCIVKNTYTLRRSFRVDLFLRMMKFD